MKFEYSEDTGAPIAAELTPGDRLAIHTTSGVKFEVLYDGCTSSERFFFARRIDNWIDGERVISEARFIIAEDQIVAIEQILD